MTLVSELIQDAYRESDIISINATPTPLEQAEALRLLNRIRLSVYGNEAGENLEPYPIGRNNIDAPTGFPFNENILDREWFAPLNRQFVFNLEAPFTLRLNPNPQDGSRFSILDMSGNFSTNNLTIDGNGRRIGGATDLVLSTDGVSREWFYHQEQGEWVEVGQTLLVTDVWPFPVEFDTMFIIMLSMRLNPRHSIAIDPQSMSDYRRSLTQFRARYKQIIPVGSEQGLIRMSEVGMNRWFDLYGNGTEQFNVGSFWRW